LHLPHIPAKCPLSGVELGHNNFESA
jgi:hypothetical protein